MDRTQALALVGDLPARQLTRLFAAGRAVGGSDLRPGIYRGRNGGGPAPAKWVARHVVRRDFFAKLILDGYGVNVRCLQDGSHSFRPSRHEAGQPEVDLPFALRPGSLDYGWHVLGVDLPLAIQLRDYLAAMPFEALLEQVGETDLARVGARRGEPCEEGELILGLIAPFGQRALAFLPFGMVWDRVATAAELASAKAHVARRRLLDSARPVKLPWLPFERRWRDAAVSALLPPAEAGFPGAVHADLDRFWPRFEEAAPVLLQLGLRAAVWQVTLLAPLLLRRPRLFPDLAPDDRDAALAALGKSRAFLIRQGLMVLKLAASFGVFADERVRHAFAEAAR